MAELIVFGDTAQLVTGVLAEACGVSCVTRVPTDRPARFIRVIRTGGPRSNLVTDAAQITVESWADNDADAHDLAQLARAVLNALPGDVIDGVPVYRVDEISGPGDLPDLLSNQSRYSQTFAVHTRGATQEEES